MKENLAELEKNLKNAEVLFQNGQHDEAVKLFQSLADEGFATAQYILGVCYCNGVGLPKDDVKASELFLKAAGQGNADAQYELGVFSQLGVAG